MRSVMEVMRHDIDAIASLARLTNGNGSPSAHIYRGQSQETQALEIKRVRAVFHVRRNQTFEVRRCRSRERSRLNSGWATSNS